MLSAGGEEQPLQKLHSDSTPLSFKNGNNLQGQGQQKLYPNGAGGDQSSTERREEEKEKKSLSLDEIGIHVQPSILSGGGAGILGKATAPNPSSQHLPKTEA